MLRQLKKPLSYKDLWEQAELLKVIKGTTSKDRINLSAALTTEIKNKPNSLFVKLGRDPILYGLKEWENTGMPHPKEEVLIIDKVIPDKGEEVDDDSNDYTTNVQTFDPIKQDIDTIQDKWSVFEHHRKIKNKRLILEGSDMDFQRKLVWKVEAKSRFIESILMGFPLPPFYLNARGEDGSYVIIDGLQRTSALRDYLEDQFTLQGLHSLQQFNGSKFSDLPIALRTKIEDKGLNVYILKHTTPLRVIYELFDRLNTGGTSLSRQEVRNGIFVGKSTVLLKKLSEQPSFQTAINTSISDNRMKDREIVLRYLAFRNRGYEAYETDLSPFLEETMKILNKMTDADIANWSKDFERTMKWSLKIFDKQNFRIPNKNGQNGMLNVAVLESVACTLAACEDAFLEKNQLVIRNNYDILVKNEDYLNAVRTQTSNKAKVIQRFKLAKQILLNLKND